jgi:hypothetical protein
MTYLCFRAVSMCDREVVLGWVANGAYWISVGRVRAARWDGEWQT